jgi:hypothetical protein
MELSQTWKERHEKKLASLNLPADSEGLIRSPKQTKSPEDSPMKAKVKEMIASGDSEMENYGRKLHAKLAQFEKEFESQVRNFIISIYYYANTRIGTPQIYWPDPTHFSIP